MTDANVYGLISLIFWSVTIIVTIKYVLLVMRADNDGEGGILSLITLITRRRTAREGADQAAAGGSGRLRRVPLLRRQHDHPGDLGPVVGRGSRGGRAGAGTA